MSELDGETSSVTINWSRCHCGAARLSCVESVDGWCETCSTGEGPVYHPKDPAGPYTEQETTK